MIYSFLVLCAFCESILVRFLIALVEEARNASRERGTKRRRSRSAAARSAAESDEFFSMNLLSSNKKSKREQSSGTKTAALVLIGLVTLAFAGVHSVCAQEQSGVAP